MPANGIMDIMRMLKQNPKILKFIPLFIKSYQDVICKYFSDETVKQTMAFQSYYCGLPPELAPGFIAFIPYSEHEGVYYPRGGMIQIPEALRRVGQKHGLELRLNTLVDRVMVRNKKAHGVILHDGTEITSKIIVSNINSRKLYLEMIGEEHIPWLARFGLKSYDLSMPFPVVYAGVDYEPDLKSHHSINVGSIELMNDFWTNRYMKGLWPEEPFGLVTMPTLSDKSLAPEGHNVVTLMGLAPYNLKDKDWDSEKNNFIETLVEFHTKNSVPGLREHIKTIECSTPLDFERKLLLPEGGIYGFQMDFPAQACFRPSSKSKSIKNLYLTGSSTHPGGGVPTVIASGIIAAAQIDKYEQ
jgi:phytoene desaturase